MGSRWLWLWGFALGASVVVIVTLIYELSRPPLRTIDRYLSMRTEDAPTPIWRLRYMNGHVRALYRVEDREARCYVLVDPDGRGSVACVPRIDWLDELEGYEGTWQEDGL